MYVWHINLVYTIFNAPPTLLNRPLKIGLHSQKKNNRQRQDSSPARARLQYSLIVWPKFQFIYLRIIWPREFSPNSFCSCCINKTINAHLVKVFRCNSNWRTQKKNKSHTGCILYYTIEFVCQQFFWFSYFFFFCWQLYNVLQGYTLLLLLCVEYNLICR